MFKLIFSGVVFVLFSILAWSMPKAKKLLEDESEAMIGVEPQASYLNRNVKKLGPFLIRLCYLLCFFSGLLFIYALINYDL